MSAAERLRLEGQLAELEEQLDRTVDRTEAEELEEQLWGLLASLS